MLSTIDSLTQELQIRVLFNHSFQFQTEVIDNMETDEQAQRRNKSKAKTCVQTFTKFFRKYFLEGKQCSGIITNQIYWWENYIRQK